MGFYPPDSLAHEAQRRGIELRAVDVNASGAECSVEPGGAVRIGLGYVRGVRAEEVAALEHARAEGGPFRSVADLAARVPAARASLEQLAWSGACDALTGPCPAGRARRSALWALGIATPGVRVPGGTQLALGLDDATVPPLRGLSRWEALLADYATSGVTLGDHALAILRPRLDGVATSAELGRLPHGKPVTVAGLVVARQRPETASGVVFMLLEDEHGAINLIVPPALYERRRHIVRAEPLILAEGRLERPPAGGGTLNVLVRDLRTLDAELEGIAVAPIGRLPAREVHSPAQAPEPVEQRVAAAGGFRAVAPAPQSFGGRGRR
jgi:error-prone DNA polymerase